MTISSKSSSKESTNKKKVDSSSSSSSSSSKKNKESQQLVGANNNNTTSNNNNSISNKSNSTLTSDANATTTASTNEEDKHKRFENEGVVCKAKLIGSELVMEPRGDKMCQNSIQRLKAIIKGTNSHKKGIVLKISFDGVKVYDEKTNEILNHHQVSQISYIASDDTDNRTFGYVSDVPNKAHQFICFKTSGPAINVMSVISALFEAVLERKNKAEKEKEEKEKGSEADKTTDAELKLIDDDKNSLSHGQLNDDNSAKDKVSLSATSGAQESIDLIGDSGIIDSGDVSTFGDDISKLSSSASHPHQQQAPRQQQSIGALHQTSLQSSGSIFDGIAMPSPGNSFSANPHTLGKIGKQSTTSSDYIFDDLFAGLSDPIIVDKNDSLFVNSQAGQQQAAGQQQFPSASPGQQQQQQAQHQHPSQANMMQQQAPPFPIPKRQSQYAVLLPPPSSLPRNAPTMQRAAGPSHNRSLVYNHSSISLSDAALTRQSSFSAANSSLNDSYVDKYAVFNDIDSLPSIFESASLGNVNKLGTSDLQQQRPNFQQQPYHHQQQPQQHQQQQPFHQFQQFQQLKQHQQFHQTAPPNVDSLLSSAFSSPSSAPPTAAAASTTATNPMMSSSSSNPASVTLPNPLANPFDDDFFA